MDERAGDRERRDVEIAYAVLNPAVPAVVLVVAGVALGRSAGLDRLEVWPSALVGRQVLVAAGALLRVVLVLVHFDVRKRA